MKRRPFLAAAGTGIVTAVAGCTDFTEQSSGGEVGALPDYQTAIPADTHSGDPQLFGYIDWKRVLELDTFSTATETPTPTPTPAESNAPSATTALVSAPLFGSLVIVGFAIGFGLTRYGDLGSQLADDMAVEDFQRDPSETPVEAVLYTSESIVVYGSFDGDAYTGDALPDGFSETDSRDGFTVYQDTDSDGVPSTAISDDQLVFSLVPGKEEVTGDDAMTRTLDTMAGDYDRFGDRDADTEWVVRAGGNHTFVFGGDATGSSDDESEYNPSVGPLRDIDPAVAVAGTSVESSDGELTGAESDYALHHSGDSVEASAAEEAYTEGEGDGVDVTVTTASGEGDGVERVRVSGSFTDQLEVQKPN